LFTMLRNPSARPRARAYHRPSIGSPLRHPFGPQRRRLWSKPPASNTPSKAHTQLVVTLLHQLAPCSYAAPSGCSVLRAVIFAVPTHRHPRLSSRRLTWLETPRPCKVFVNRWVLLRLLRVPPPRLYKLHAWPLLAIAVPTAYTVVFVNYDFATNVIASSSTWREVHTGPALRMLGAGNTAACFRPRRVPVPGKLGSAPRLHRPRQRLLRHRLLRLPRPRHRRFFLRTLFWQNRSMPTPRTCA
jgi:hypothetical protein